MGNGRSLRVFVVEDEALLAMELCDILEDLGHEVIGPTPSVSKALALLATVTQLPDVAIIDANLAGETSCPVMDRLRVVGGSGDRGLGLRTPRARPDGPGGRLVRGQALRREGHRQRPGARDLTAAGPGRARGLPADQILPPGRSCKGRAKRSIDGSEMSGARSSCMSGASRGSSSGPRASRSWPLPENALPAFEDPPCPLPVLPFTAEGLAVDLPELVGDALDFLRFGRCPRRYAHGVLPPHLMLETLGFERGPEAKGSLRRGPLNRAAPSRRRRG